MLLLFSVPYRTVPKPCTSWCLSRSCKPKFRIVLQHCSFSERYIYIYLIRLVFIWHVCHYCVIIINKFSEDKINSGAVNLLMQAPSTAWRRFLYLPFEFLGNRFEKFEIAASHFSFEATKCQTSLTMCNAPEYKWEIKCQENLKAVRPDTAVI